MVHDNRITGYSVNIEERSLIIHTCHEDRNILTDIIFTDVMTHSFDCVMPDSIILDLTERSIVDFVDDNLDQLLELQPFGWPVFYRSMTELEDLLAAENFHYFALSSSYGMFGWVLAKGCKISS